MRAPTPSAAAELAASRPTAVNLFWALERMANKAEDCGGDPAVLVEEAKAGLYQAQTEQIRRETT